MLVALEWIAAFYMRGREGCSPSHHKVLMQGLDIRKSASGRSIFENAWVVTDVTICYKTCMRDDCKTDVVGTSPDSGAGSRKQLPLAKPHENKRSNQWRLHSMLWCWSHKLWMSMWAKDKCMLTVKTKEKGWWSSQEAQKLGKELAGVAGHKSNTSISV